MNAVLDIALQVASVGFGFMMIAGLLAIVS